VTPLFSIFGAVQIEMKALVLVIFQLFHTLAKAEFKAGKT
jgi:hypothetical protein